MNDFSRKPVIYNFYLNLQLGLKQDGVNNCEKTLAEEKAAGIKQKLVWLIHFYKHHDLIGIRDRFAFMVCKCNNKLFSRVLYKMRFWRECILVSIC